jgi:hypothetical protein
MGIFLPTAAYNYQPIVSAAVPQEAGYTYYLVKSSVDLSIPQWTIRIANSITASNGFTGFNPLNNVVVSANAQYASASFGGRQQAPMSMRSINGTTSASFGLVGRIAGFSSGGLFTDEWITTTCNGAVNSTCSNVYGSNANIENTAIGNTTKYNSSWNNWNNQPYLNKCATYTANAAVAHQFISCSVGSPVTSSANDVVCGYDYAATTNNSSLRITNYYSSSCGTH